MNKTCNHTIQSRVALLLLAVFVGSLLIKPAHSLLSHHSQSEEICSFHEQGLIADHYKDCPICDFEFCSFIPQSPVNISQLAVITASKQVPPIVSCLTPVSSHIFQLRAPPVL